ncbi:uncharacterized protein LOC127565664 isoform X1 [Drosophila albomicans]|uniref:Uncharacterized protein LOC127565664 isoform X1 n=1 Tax=Drosophila albomicans TaxID=7291 RepID=A0A9C6W6K7_DROAB|nr:uncharacterized protein LOC127565664 isoform X1 [Drosophila albomicans]
MMTTLQRCRRSNCDRARVVADDAAAGSGPCGWLAAAGDGCLTGNESSLIVELTSFISCRAISKAATTKSNRARAEHIKPNIEYRATTKAKCRSPNHETSAKLSNGKLMAVPIVFW